MRLFFLTSLAVWMFSADIAKAQIEDLRSGPTPAWVTPSALRAVPENAMGLAFIRRSDQFTHLHEKGQLNYQSQRIKLLDPRALEVGNVGISWNPEAGDPTVHKLLIHRDDEIINVLEKNKFEILRREEQLEQSMLNGFLTAVLRVPDLRIGDELEWAFSVPSNDPTLGTDSYGLMALAAVPLAGRYAMGVSWEDGQEPTILISDDLSDFQDRQATSLSVTLEDPQMLRPVKYAPTRYSWTRIIEFSDFSSWKPISKKFHSLFATASAIPGDSKIKKEAARIAKSYSTKSEQAAAALELVQQQVRYIYVGLDGGNIQPATAEETWDRRYGDCKGKSVLLMALLRELGIEAEFVLVNNTGIDDGFDERLPNPALFDHILLRADLDGEKNWLDPTLPSIIEPNLDPLVPYRWVLPLSSEGHDLEAREQKPFALPQEMGLIEYDAREGFNKPARKVQATVKRGIAGMAEYLRYSAFSAQQLKNALSNSLTGESSWNKIEDVAYRYDRKTQASVLTITGTGTIDWDDEGHGSYDLTLPHGGFSPPSRRQRPSDHDNDIPYYWAPSYSCHATTVRLPKETDLGYWGFNSTFSFEIFGRKYYRMMERRDDHTIRMVRSSRVEEPEITSERARNDNNRLSHFDNSMARIEYTPEKFRVLVGKSEPVPATYDIDWTGSNPPCVSNIVRSAPRVITPRDSFRKDAETGDADAQYKLGVDIMVIGEFSDATIDEALGWLKKAAAQGHKRANLDLGRYYVLEEKDLKKAVRYLNQSEDKKDGAFFLADIYLRNPDLFPDVSNERIMELYRISSENDHTNAQRELAELYRTGSMIQRDEVEALKWVIIAYGANASLNDRFKKDLSEAEIQKASNLAGEWIKAFRKDK